MAVNEYPSVDQIIGTLLTKLPANKSRFVAEYIQIIFKIYAELHFAYLEVVCTHIPLGSFEFEGKGCATNSMPNKATVY